MNIAHANCRRVNRGEMSDRGLCAMTCTTGHQATEIVKPATRGSAWASDRLSPKVEFWDGKWSKTVRGIKTAGESNKQVHSAGNTGK